MHIFYIFFFLLSEYWPPHSHPGPSGFHIRTGMSVLIMPVLSFYARIHCISCWMQNICLLLSDIFHVLPAYIQAWKGTDRIRYPVSLFQSADLRLSLSGSDLPHIPHHTSPQGHDWAYDGNLSSGSLSFHHIMQPFSSVSDSSCCPFRIWKVFSVPGQAFSQHSGIERWSFIFMGVIFGSFRDFSCRQIFPFTIFVV